MGIFNKKKNKDRLMVVFDVGSGSVGGAYVLLQKDKDGHTRPTILAQARSEMQYQDEIDFEKFSFFMNKALEETAHKLLMKKIGKPEKVYCVLSSPWYISETRNVHIEKKEKFFTSQKMMDEIIQKELKSVASQFQKKYEDGNDKPILLENVVLESLVNGYKVQDPLNKKASKLDLVMYLSVAPEKVVETVKHTVRKVFPHTDIFFASFIMSFYNAARFKHDVLDSHLLVDVNAEITDVGMVTDGLLTSFFSFPVGRNSIFRAIAKNKNVSKDQAESLFGMYASGTLDEVQKVEMNKILAEVEKAWKNVFYKSIVEMSRLTGYTDKVCLVSHEDTAAYFSFILENPNVPLQIKGDRKFSVNIMTGEDLKNLCVVKNGPCDQFLMSEALCLAYVYAV